jgi:multidrug resistance efflux pump
MKGIFWLLGILLLIGMFIGAKMVFEQSAAAHAKEQSDIDANKPLDKIIAWGNFDVEPGVAGLYPKQYGELVKVAPEHTHVKAGDVLLQVDDRLAQLKVKEAKADVDASEQQVTEAKQLTQFYALQKKLQGYKIDAIENEVNKLKSERDVKLNSADKTQAIYKTIQELYDFGLAQLSDKKKAEVTTLEQLKLQDADLKIAQAQADLDAKKVRLEQAQELLKHFKVVAPSDGTILRVHVHKGETLGPNPRIYAIEFLPDAPIIVRAEVLQEWGHYVKVGQEVTIEDDTYKGPEWKGTVKSISKWYAPTRSPIIEPFRYNDVRTLECIITVDSGGAEKFIGQRVRAKIKL